MINFKNKFDISKNNLDSDTHSNAILIEFDRNLPDKSLRIMNNSDAD